MFFGYDMLWYRLNNYYKKIITLFQRFVKNKNKKGRFDVSFRYFGVLLPCSSRGLVKCPRKRDMASCSLPCTFDNSCEYWYHRSTLSITIQLCRINVWDFSVADVSCKPAIIVVYHCRFTGQPSFPPKWEKLYFSWHRRRKRDHDSCRKFWIQRLVQHLC